MRPTTPKEFSPAIKERVRERSSGICEAKLFGCVFAAAVYHHRLMRSQGGRGHMANAMHVCPRCHERIHLNPAQSYQQGFLVRSSDPLAASLR